MKWKKILLLHQIRPWFDPYSKSGM